VLAGITIIVSHFTFLFFYQFKPNKYSFFYVYPYFHQSWNLFVPPPHKNYHLYAIYDNGIERTDVFQELLLKHQSNRLAGYEPFVIGLSNTIHYYENENSETNFLMLEKFVKQYLQYSRKKKITDLKLLLVVNSVSDGSSKVYHNWSFY